MRSYVNNIPLPARAIQRILATAEPLTFDRIYGAFATIDSNANHLMGQSLRRYIDWVTGAVED